MDDLIKPQLPRDDSVQSKPIYYISNRPEAYEIFGEVPHEAAHCMGETIARQAALRFPDIEFRVDSTWHAHQRGMEKVTAYIESHWQHWVTTCQTD